MPPSDKEVDELLSDHSDHDAEWEEDDEDPSVFRIRDQLNPPVALWRTTKQLHEEIHMGQIDLNPEYQREVVWSQTKQISIIDSIYRNFYIPPVIFATHKDDDGTEVKICVDGKQRLTSIQKFFDGQIPHRDPVTKKAFWYTRPESKKGSKLEVPEPFKKAFAEKVLTCVVYHNLPRGKEQEIFQRVQLGVPLTAAEKLQALSGPWPDFIAELNTKYIEREDGLAHLLNWDTRRGRNFECLAKFVYAAYRLPTNDQPTNQKLERFLVLDTKPEKVFAASVERALTNFCEIAEDKELNSAFRKTDKKVAPVEFVYIAVLLYRMLEIDLKTCASCIHTLRTVVRAEHKDVRSNGAVSKTLWKTIEQIVNNPNIAYGGEDTAMDELDLFGDQKETVASSSAKVGGSPKKRKRPVQGADEEDRPYRPTSSSMH